eukprot:SAG31_NODE_44603_length_262_cov_0.631902_1_plen_43_part_10
MDTSAQTAVDLKVFQDHAVYSLITTIVASESWMILVDRDISKY